jgi:hypothetical protein
MLRVWFVKVCVLNTFGITLSMPALRVVYYSRYERYRDRFSLLVIEKAEQRTWSWYERCMNLRHQDCYVHIIYYQKSPDHFDSSPGLVFVNCCLLRTGSFIIR